MLRQRNICRDTKNLLSATARHRLTARHWVLVDLSGFLPCSTSVARSEGPRPSLPTNVFMARGAGVGERGGSHVVVPATWISFTEIGFRQPPFTAAAGAWHESRSYHSLYSSVQQTRKATKRLLPSTPSFIAFVFFVIKSKCHY